ncbi:MAG: pantetheine-phosphate adenylyltransferase [Bdellovibrionota bacterium]
MSQIAVYPGSFDPITSGHVDIIHRLSEIFDEVIVLVAQSGDKSYMFTAEERAEFVKKQFSHKKNIQVDIFQGLTVDYMKKKGAKVIVRGLRAVADFEYEGTLANINKKLAPEIETFMIFSKPEYYFISSRGVKELAKNGGALTGLVPDIVIPELVKKLNKG